jgi:ATP-dependent 26S proteasome regulatory subunit
VIEVKRGGEGRDGREGKNKQEVDKTEVIWKTFSIQTNKNFQNTILSDEAKRNLVDDVHRFVDNEDYYNNKGIAYRRGYLLYGIPGSGKTSIIKAIASHYGMDIFLINMGDIESVKELTLVFQGTRITNGYHIVCFEDIDRCPFLQPQFGYGPRFSIESKNMIRTFMNELDGILETPKCIYMFTANDKSYLDAVPAFIRPGRIDKQIELGYCDAKQLSVLYNHFSDCKEVMDMKELKDQVSPAQVVKYILQNPDITPTELENKIGIISTIEVKESKLSSEITGEIRGRRRRRRRLHPNTPVAIKRRKLSMHRRMLRRFETHVKSLPKKIERKKITIERAEKSLEKSITIEKKRKERDRQQKARAKKIQKNRINVSVAN